MAVTMAALLGPASLSTMSENPVELEPPRDHRLVEGTATATQFVCA